MFNVSAVSRLLTRYLLERLLVRRIRFANEERLLDDPWVINEILTDVGVVGLHSDALRLQSSGWADAGNKQQLGRSNRSSGENDLLRRSDVVVCR